MKTFRNCLMTAAAAGLLSLGLAAPANAGAIRLGMTTWVGYGPLFLARDLGYFKEAGVDVDLKIIEESALYMAAVAGGDLDGAASTVDELMKYRSDELCFKYVVALDDSHGGDGVVTQPDVKSLKDLKGQPVALNEGSVSEFWFNVLLKKEGMTEDDVSVTNMTADDAATAFIAGQVPAAVTWEPHLTEVRKGGKGKVLIDSTTTPGLIVDVIALKCDLIEKHPEDVKALIKGYYKAVEYIKTNPEKAYEIMAKGIGGYLEKPEDFAAGAKGVRYYDRARNLEFFGTPEKSEAADLVNFAQDIWGKAGKLKMTIDSKTILDTDFIKEQ
ncbi:ABC transporter substrate-binding protein [Mesorhizobium sp. WSM4935]|uniref:ABC transporter substrate-binding protein n=1 Tax=Mesorhizobium sp. WSM4935 TaxID=3038547 RepID=UPI000500A79B|nr:ABC transporter substrate-binding protein [Mesorhizobium sp. WSM4935]MDG4874959.1 ABC transporter substrate-binding protein [Mesorhizobium sp. WSM4935]CDX30165.1 NMT1/THI5 like domain protein [Mesorhizobium sp. SOD10]